MDIEKSQDRLQFTSDQDPILCQTFFMNQHFTDLYLYSGKLIAVSEHFSFPIDINFDTLFEIIQNENKKPLGLRIYTNSRAIEFKRQFWDRSKEWQCELLKQVKRKNFHQFFRPLKKIGKGNFASVYLAQDLRFERLVAVKAFMKESAYKNDGKEALINEIKIMRDLDSEYIAKLYGVYETENSVYLVMQYVEGINLEQYLKSKKKVNFEERKKIIKALLEGAKEMSQKGVLHRDLKPENIIVGNELTSIKIVDFGLATHVHSEKYIFVRCGTPGFVAPQILKIKQTSTARLSTISDIFSIGAIFYQLIFDVALFNGKDQNEILKKNRECAIKIADKDIIEDERNLLVKMLEVNPFERFTASSCLSSLYFYESQYLKNRNRILTPICIKSK